MSRVTADDLAFADRLLVALGRDPVGPRRREVAQIISDIHDRAVACAVVRLERDYVMRARKATPRQGEGP